MKLQEAIISGEAGIVMCIKYKSLKFRDKMDVMILDTTPKQIEDWHYNYSLKKKQKPRIMKIRHRFPNCDVENVRMAFKMLVQKHESLRTCFPLIDGKIKQKINEYSAIYELRVYNKKEINNISDFIYSLENSLKNIQNGSLLHGILIDQDGEGYEFFLIIHHIVSDMWSIEIIKKDLLAFYNHLTQNAILEIDEEQLQLRHYTAYFKEHRISIHEESLQHWLMDLSKDSWKVDYNVIYQKLSASFPNLIPEHYMRGDRTFLSGFELEKNPDGESYSVICKGEIYSRLQSYKKQINTGVFSILLTSLNILYHRLTGRNDLVVLSHFSNRHEVRTQSIIGNLIGKLIHHTKLNEKDSFKESIITASQNFVDSIDKIVFNSETLKKLNLVTSSFVFLNFINKEREVGPIYLAGKNTLMKSRVESPLVCEVIEFSNCYVINWSYHLSYYNFEMIKVISSLHLSLLSKMVMFSDRNLLTA
ncbi:condensation domain-containing protein [Pedobacter roseus]|uniref:Condensation domain-containing protein n=1 Tax=Pedobacter roseus TaxID=336820 RepID=A0A7G9QKT3_9SPHI|nr:condensation domain-containing protein [Pedobacter roseus]QNN43958.1 hypothetical protein H9L23_07720 [Pedobacter roseus]